MNKIRLFIPRALVHRLLRQRLAADRARSGKPFRLSFNILTPLRYLPEEALTAEALDATALSGVFSLKLQ